MSFIAHTVAAENLGLLPGGGRADLSLLSGTQSSQSVSKSREAQRDRVPSEGRKHSSLTRSSQVQGLIKAKRNFFSMPSKGHQVPFHGCGDIPREAFSSRQVNGVTFRNYGNRVSRKKEAELTLYWDKSTGVKSIENKGKRRERQRIKRESKMG